MVWFWLLHHKTICPNRKKRRGAVKIGYKVVSWKTIHKKGFECKNATYYDSDHLSSLTIAWEEYDGSQNGSLTAPRRQRPSVTFSYFFVMSSTDQFEQSSVDYLHLTTPFNEAAILRVRAKHVPTTLIYSHLVPVLSRQADLKVYLKRLGISNEQAEWMNHRCDT